MENCKNLINKSQHSVCRFTNFICLLAQSNAEDRNKNLVHTRQAFYQHAKSLLSRSTKFLMFYYISLNIRPSLCVSLSLSVFLSACLPLFHSVCVCKHVYLYIHSKIVISELHGYD